MPILRRPNPRSRLRVALALGLATSVVRAASAATLHVDALIGPATCADYAPAARACGGGSDVAFRAIAGAAAVAAPGDVVLLRGGTYAEALVPGTSGLPGQPITYRSYDGESAIISRASLDPAIDLSGRSHVVLELLAVDGVVGWLRAQDSHWNVVRACTFSRATAGGSRAGLKLIDATYNRIEGNVIDDGNDNLLLIASDRNVVLDNRITRARHGLWSILCGNENILRGNYFHNAIQKAGQITDCEGVPSDTPIRFDATRRNLVEGNEFAYTASSGNASPYAGIQHSAQECIIRRNFFHDTVGPAFDLTLYADEAQYNTGNRICHDVFLSTDFAGVSIADGAAAFSDNVLVNNVIARSSFVANDTRWAWYTNDLAGRPVQVLTGRLDGFRFERNDIVGSGTAGEDATVVNGVRWSGTNPPFETLAWWEASHPALFADNVDVEPGFVDEAGLDVHLAAESALIDAGAFLTRAVGSGASNRLPVQDAGWFVDGFGIPGELGDLVQLEGTSQAVRIVSIDRALDELELERSVAWTDGQGVSLAFSGAAPDIGMHEWVGAATSDLLRNTTLTERTLVLHPMLFTAGRDPALDPVRDLHVADVGAMTEYRLADEALPVGEGAPGVVAFYEVTNAAGTLRVAKQGAEVVLGGW